MLSTSPAPRPATPGVTPLIVSPTFTQMQGLRQYYRFPDALDVDRYQLEGENARLKKLVANQALDIDMLKEISAGNF